MDNAYFVMHPSIGVTAEVYAPATEKARTTYLDWLERRGYINRADRQFYRKNMVAERLEDPLSVKADITLHYGYQTSSGMSYIPPAEHFEEPMDIDRSLDIEEFEVPEVERKGMPIVEVQRSREPTMPIQKVMLGRFD